MEKFLDQLDSNECYELLKRNKMTTYIEKGNTFFDNINSGERGLDLLPLNKTRTRGLLQIEFSYSVDFDSYISKNLMAIKSVNDNKYDMLTINSSKFLLYNFNNYLSRRGSPVKHVRHTIVSEDLHGLLRL